jgi:hypothetical protein
MVQLYETASWWATNRSVVQASQWLAEIETAIQGLADTAPRHPLAREADAFDFPVHQMNFGVSNKPTHFHFGTSRPSHKSPSSELDSSKRLPKLSVSSRLVSVPQGSPPLA